MADTISDQILTGAAYEDLYDLTGITVGDALIIQNKTSNYIWVQLSLAQPSANSKDGYAVKADSRFPIKVESGENGCWAIGKGPISVQAG